MSLEIKKSCMIEAAEIDAYNDDIGESSLKSESEAIEWEKIYLDGLKNEIETRMRALRQREDEVNEKLRNRFRGIHNIGL